MLTRIFIVASFAACLASCQSLPADEKRLVGMWRFEDSNTIVEMRLGSDHTFQSEMRHKNELTTPGSFPYRGQWRYQGTQLTIDSAMAYIPTDRRTRTGAIDTARDVLLVKSFDGTRTLTYRRLR